MKIALCGAPGKKETEKNRREEFCYRHITPSVSVVAQSFLIIKAKSL
jgi:hypothetical protein